MSSWKCITNKFCQIKPLQLEHLEKNHPQKHKFASPEKFDF